MKVNIGIGWKKVVFAFSNDQRLCSLQAFYDNQAMSLFGSENLEAESVVIDLQPEEYIVCLSGMQCTRHRFQQLISHQ